MENKSKNSMIIGVVAALIIGMVGGYAIGMSMDNNDEETTNASMSQAAEGTMVGGALMVKDKDIVDNAANASNVSTTVSLVKMAGLVEVLKGEGPFTVFGPNNDAYAKIDAATVESLQKPENVEALKNILTYHVVPGTYTSADLKVMAQKGETLTTVQGQMITPTMNGGSVTLVDAMGNTVEIETADVISSNGVTHVIKSVLMPKS